MRIIAVQNNYHIGHFEHNFKKIVSAMELHGHHCDLLVFSELCLTGYYPYDLIHRASFIRDQNHVLQRVVEQSKSCSAAIVLGLIEHNPNKGRRFYNSLAVVHQGAIVYRYHKQLLPVYNIFDEARHFEPAGDQALFMFKGKKLAFLICEDVWGDHEHIYHRDPVDYLCQQSPDIVITLNASPSNLGKFHKRIHHAKRVARRLQKPLLYVNQVGGNDEIVYDGASFALNAKGTLLGELKHFEEDVGAVVVDGALSLIKGFEPRVPVTDATFLLRQISLGLNDYLAKSGFKQIVVGVSGGIDSAVTLALAVYALGKNNVHAIFMPTQFTQASSYEGARALAKALDVPLFEYPLELSFELSVKEFEEVFGQAPSSLTQENIQARIRGRILMAYSNHTGALVLSTGNKSEVSVGYTTLYGDMTGGLNLIGDLYKTQVYELAYALNEHWGKKVIPDVTFNKAPSAELSPNQKDTDSLPPYEVLDPILKLYLEGDLLREDERHACLDKIKQLDCAFLEKIHRMVDTAEFKRRQAAPIIRVQRRSFGWGRKMPITAHY